VGSRVRINRHARLAALKLDNLVHCFNALEKAGVSVEQIRPKDIYDKNQKYVTRLVMQMMARFDPDSLVREDNIISGMQCHEQAVDKAAVRELWGQRDSGKCPLLKKSLELDEHHKDRQFKEAAMRHSEGSAKAHQQQKEEQQRFLDEQQALQEALQRERAREEYREAATRAAIEAEKKHVAEELVRQAEALGGYDMSALAKEFAKVAASDTQQVEISRLASFLEDGGVPSDRAAAYSRGFDRDGNGSIDVREFQVGLLALGSSRSVTCEIPLADVDEDEIMEVYDDLAMQLGLPPSDTMTSQAVRTIVQSAMDRGDIDPITLTSTTGLSTDAGWLSERAMLLFRIYDENADGQLEFEELVTMVAHSNSVSGDCDGTTLAAARAQAREIRSYIGTGMLDRPITLQEFKHAMVDCEGGLSQLGQRFVFEGLPIPTKPMSDS